MMNFKITPAKLCQYYLPVTLTLFMLVTVKHPITGYDSIDTVYGFPLPYITSNAGCTGCYIIFYGALIADIGTYFAIVWLIVGGIQQLGLKFKPHWLPMTIGILLSCFWIWFFYLITADSHFQFKNDWPYKMTHSEVIINQGP